MPCHARRTSGILLARGGVNVVLWPPEINEHDMLRRGGVNMLSMAALRPAIEIKEVSAIASLCQVRIVVECAEDALFVCERSRRAVTLSMNNPRP